MSTQDTNNAAGGYSLSTEVLERMPAPQQRGNLGVSLYTGDQVAEFVMEEVRREREACKKAIISLRDDHCEATYGECNSGSGGWSCDFVTAWDDAIAEIDKRSNGGANSAALQRSPMEAEGRNES